jgi:hypothetical protein
MQAHAVKLQAPPIERESFLFVKGDATNSKWGEVSVADVLAFHHLAHQGVEVRVIDVPKLRPCHSQAGRDGLGGVGGNGDPFAVLAGCFSRGIEDDGPQDHARGVVEAVANLGFHLDRSFLV